jgi:hypothetical protein
MQPNHDVSFFFLFLFHGSSPPECPLSGRRANKKQPRRFYLNQKIKIMSFVYSYYSAFLVPFLPICRTQRYSKKIFEFLTTHFYLIRIFNLSATGDERSSPDLHYHISQEHLVGGRVKSQMLAWCQDPLHPSKRTPKIC